jgi:hypothetical protein
MINIHYIADEIAVISGAQQRVRALSTIEERWQVGELLARSDVALPEAVVALKSRNVKGYGFTEKALETAKHFYKAFPVLEDALNVTSYNDWKKARSENDNN